MAKEYNLKGQAGSEPAGNDLAEAFKGILKSKFGENTGLTACGLVTASTHRPPKKAKSGKIWEFVETTITDGTTTFTHLQMNEGKEGTSGDLKPIPQFSAVRITVNSANTNKGGNPELMGKIEIV